MQSQIVLTKPNPNSIAGWRQKQVSFFGYVHKPTIFHFHNYVLQIRQKRQDTFVCPFIDWCSCQVKFRSLHPRLSSSWKRRASILQRVTSTIKPHGCYLFHRLQRYSKITVLWGLKLLQEPAVVLHLPKFIRRSNIFCSARWQKPGLGRWSRSLTARDWTGMKAVLFAYLMSFS